MLILSTTISAGLNPFKPYVIIQYVQKKTNPVLVVAVKINGVFEALILNVDRINN